MANVRVPGPLTLPTRAAAAPGASGNDDPGDPSVTARLGDTPGPAGTRMRAALLGAVLALCTAAAHAESCERVVLALDPHLTAETLDRDWASGETRAEAPAALELRGCAGELLDRVALPAPLARLDPSAVRGAPHPTWLVTVDLTADAGSYSGPLTMPVEIVDHKLRAVQAVAADGTRAAVHLALTGKAAWQKVATRTGDDFLAVDCEPRDGGFVTVYRRFHPDAQGWRMRARTRAGLWESDGPFPAATLFP